MFFGHLEEHPQPTHKFPETPVFTGVLGTFGFEKNIFKTWKNKKKQGLICPLFEFKNLLISVLILKTPP
jgi:hypothetical protein